MHITGERRIPAPRERVWRSLADAAVLQACVPGSQIEQDADGLVVSGIGGAPLHAQPTIREQFTKLGWRIDPKGAATQMVLVQLTEQGVFTLLHYEVSLADADGEDTAVRTENLRARIDQGLERLVHTVAGTGEIAAGGIAGAVQAATEPSAQPNASMHAPSKAGAAGAGAAGARPAGPAGALTGPALMSRLLNPSVIGGALFLIVLLFLVGLL